MTQVMPVASTVPAAIVHAEAVRGGWRLVEVLERMTPEAAKRLLADHWRAQAEHAARTLPYLQPWDRVPARAMKVYRNTPDQVRMRRILDFVEPGDRVLDIGSGYGYLTGVILRDSPAAAYTGIDLGAHIVESARQMIDVNGLDGRRAHLEPMDLYDLTPDWVAGHAPDLLVCCEVLEHVPDAEKALRVIAEAMPADGALIFSVPILGRLEACWGHISLFDAARIQQMVAAAGLHVQHVEALYNTWALVLVSPRPDPVPRLARVLARPPAVPDQVPTRDSAWQRLSLSPATVSVSRWRHRSREVRVDHVDGGARCTVVGSRAPAGPLGRMPGRGWERLLRRLPRRVAARLHLPARGQGQYGGLNVRLPTRGFAAVRLELSFTGGQGIRSVYVDAVDGRSRVGRWRWTVGPTHPTDSPATVVLRPGQPTSHFTPTGPFHPGDATHLDVFVAVAPGAEVTIALHRAAVVR